MRLFVFWLAVFALCVSVSFAWTKEDHEIFDLVSALEAAEGKGTTFYSWLEVTPSSTSAEISRAYKKKSMQLHPDKNRGRKDAHERFARLGVIAKILRDPEGRKRYDFFYKNGVPRWRGTGYYYSRYRPGLGSVVVFLILITNGLHYVVMRLNYRSDLARINRFIGDARLAAWGPKLTRLEGRRKVKVNLGGRAYMDEDGNIVPGKQLDMVVDGDDVYIVEPGGELLLLDESAATKPTLKRTWMFILASSIFRKMRGGSGDGIEVDGVAGQDAGEEIDGESSSTDSPGSGTVTPKNEIHVATTKAGGRRRKQLAPRRKGGKREETS